MSSNANSVGGGTKYFFFSSRRRHTRCSRDWSSDVCSSDLGEEFADSFDTWFFAKTFPTLFPFGNGGPRQAEESITDVAEGVGVATEADATAQSLLSSRNMSLETWARSVLQRHGGHFATHHIFAFLVFNMLVKSKNRRVSMLSVRRKNFPEVERIVQSLSAERLKRAKEDLEVSGKTIDKV